MIATPVKGEGGMTTIEFKLIEAGDEALKAAGLEAFIVNDAKGFTSAELTPEQRDGLLKALNQTQGVNLLSGPRVGTVDGQEAMLEVSDGTGNGFSVQVNVDSTNPDGSIGMDLGLNFGDGSGSLGPQGSVKELPPSFAPPPLPPAPPAIPQGRSRL